MFLMERTLCDPIALTSDLDGNVTALIMAARAALTEWWAEQGRERSERAEMPAYENGRKLHTVRFANNWHPPCGGLLDAGRVYSVPTDWPLPPSADILDTDNRPLPAGEQRAIKARIAADAAALETGEGYMSEARKARDLKVMNAQVPSALDGRVIEPGKPPRGLTPTERKRMGK